MLRAPTMRSRKRVKRLNEIAEEVRAKGELSVWDIAKKYMISYTAAYQYAKLVALYFDDIEYEGGVLRIKTPYSGA